MYILYMYIFFCLIYIRNKHVIRHWSAWYFTHTQSCVTLGMI